MKSTFFIVIATLLLVSCSKEKKWVLPKSNIFSFIEAETTIPIKSSTTYFNLIGRIETEMESYVLVNLVANETTAVPGIHYKKTKTIAIEFYGQKQMGYTFDLIPENITEEVRLTFEVDKDRLMPGGIGKTVIRLVPTK